MRLWQPDDEKFVREYRAICIQHQRMLKNGVVVPFDNDHHDDIRSKTVDRREKQNARKARKRTGS